MRLDSDDRNCIEGRGQSGSQREAAIGNFGKDDLIGLREGLGDKADKLIVATQSYETTDPTVDSQIVALEASGANVLLTAAVPKFAAQAIRKVYDIGWKPTHFLSSVANAVGSVMRPVGFEKAVGIISATYAKDPTDPQWQASPEYNDWLTLMHPQILPTISMSTVTRVRRPWSRC